jgi:hypothetical protein
MLALDLVEKLGCLAIVAPPKGIHCVIVEWLYWLIDIEFLVLRPAGRQEQGPAKERGEGQGSEDGAPVGGGRT